MSRGSGFIMADSPASAGGYSPGRELPGGVTHHAEQGIRGTLPTPGPTIRRQFSRAKPPLRPTSHLILSGLTSHRGILSGPRRTKFRRTRGGSRRYVWGSRSRSRSRARAVAYQPLAEGRGSPGGATSDDARMMHLPASGRQCQAATRSASPRMDDRLPSMQGSICVEGRSWC